MKKLILAFIFLSVNLQAFELFGFKYSGTVYWRIDGEVPEYFRDSVLFSIEQYTTVSNLKFEEVCSGENLLIKFTDIPNEFLGLTGATIDSNNFVTKATIFINKTKLYAESLKKRVVRKYKRWRVLYYHLHTLMLHEMGHALGLNHNDTNPYSVMSSSIPVREFRLLDQDDISGIQAIYGIKLLK